MLGVVENPHDDPADQLLRELGEELGVGESYQQDAGRGVLRRAGRRPSPTRIFGGEGPDRTGCRLCGRCMVGCPHGAKNTLVKNYLYFAEKHGARVLPERTVVDVRPLGAGSGEEGYEVESVRSGAWVHKETAGPPRARRAQRPSPGHGQLLHAPAWTVTRPQFLPARRAGATEQQDQS